MKVQLSRKVEYGTIRLLHGGTATVWKTIYSLGGKTHTNYHFDLHGKRFIVRHVRDLAVYGTITTHSN